MYDLVYKVSATRVRGVCDQLGGRLLQPGLYRCKSTTKVLKASAFGLEVKKLPTY